jgi:opacity protein-like surface antigen
MSRSLATFTILLGTIAMTSPTAAAESDAIRQRDDRIEHLENTLEAVVEELARLRDQVAVPEEPELVSSYGLGPAASKIYGLPRGLSIGGYAEANYRAFVDDKDSGDLDRADFLRMVLYLGYKFTEKLVFNSEIEFEHGTTSAITNVSGNGSVSVEFAALDFFWHEKLNFRAGILLSPMGFLNEVHEPPFFYGVQRPVTEQTIIPTTWRENGVGIFGNLTDTLEYRLYAVTGFNGSRFSDAGIRGGRQNGNRALAEDWAGIARLDWRPDSVPGLLLGGSVYFGEADQDVEVGGVDVDETDLLIAELHAQYQNGPFHTRALFAYSELSNVRDFNFSLGNAPGVDAPVAGAQMGGYVEFAYDVWSLLFGDHTKQLEPFFRIEYVDTQRQIPSGFRANRNRTFWLYNPGLQFHPHPNVVLKLEYRNFDTHEGERPDEVAVGMGLAF